MLRSLREMSEKVQRGKNDALAHHVFIKLIVSDALDNLNVKVSWEKFVDMDKWAFLESHESIQESIPERDVKGKKKDSKDETSKKNHSQNKIRVDPTNKEVVANLIKMRTPPKNPLKLKEKSISQEHSRKSYRRDRTRSQSNPKLITPISSSIVNVEDYPSPMGRPLGAPKEAEANKKGLRRKIKLQL
jgi:hypothetical protein